MAAFSFHQQNHPLFLDSLFYSNPPNSSFFPQFFHHENPQHYQGMMSMDFSTVHESYSSLEQSSKMISQSNSVTTKQSPACSSVVPESTGEVQVTQKLLASPTDKKRKYKNGSSSNSAQSKNTTRDQVKKKTGKKQKKSINGDVEEDKKVIDQETPPPPTGYIHVRARRGQATDSHSLAERVRREKISERMKLLQAIVPGCDKVTGKALMLEEIINYVQSLQNQVEFLSMNLASANPMFYDFGVDLDTFMVTPESLSRLEPQMPNMQQCSPTGSSNTFIIPNNYSLVDSSAAASLALQQGQQIPNILSQGNRQVLWGVDGPRQKLIDQSTFSNNLFSFH